MKPKVILMIILFFERSLIMLQICMVVSGSTFDNWYNYFSTKIERNQTGILTQYQLFQNIFLFLNVIIQI